MESMADRLIGCDDLIETLDTDSMLRLGRHLEQEEGLRRLFGLLDSRMAQAPERTTGTLIKTGWWFAWKRGSQLSGHLVHVSALEWITSDVWTDEKCEATLECWNQAVDDLPRKLTSQEMGRLCGGVGRLHRRWPWIPPFEEAQLEAIIGRAADLGMLTDLAEALVQDEFLRGTSDPTYAFQYVLERSSFATGLAPLALAWLSQAGFRQHLQPLDLDQSALLYLYSGHRSRQALQARIQSVAARLDHRHEQAFRAADEDPPLWEEPDFLSCVAEWMCRQGSLEAIGREAAYHIDLKASVEPSRYPQAPRSLVQRLVDEDYSKAAKLLSPDLYRVVGSESTVEAVLEALINKQSSGKCWSRLAEAIRETSGQPEAIHLLREVAQRARRLPRPKQMILRRHGWETFS